MEYLKEFRDSVRARKLVDKIIAGATRRWTIMEVCGGQTHAIIRYGIDNVLDKKVRLIHGPGCPVCVTPIEYIDCAIHVAGLAGVTLCTYGDMLRIPGSLKDLFVAKSEGADVRTIYSSLDAIRLARSMPAREVVFFGVGFETTAPATARAIALARQQKLENFSVLCAHVLVPPAMTALLDSPENIVQAYLAAGHVCTIQGEQEYEAIASKYQVPVIVTGFEPIDILAGIDAAVAQLESGQAFVENRYSRVARDEGNLYARQQVEQVFEVSDRKWRGLGMIPGSGLKIRGEYEQYDAEQKFGIKRMAVKEPQACIAGEILTGNKRPYECPSFGKACTPINPIGATMVSAEGACAAYFAYGRSRTELSKATE